MHFEKTVVSMRMDVVDDFIMFISSAFNAHFFTVFLKIEVTPESRYALLLHSCFDADPVVQD